MFPSQDSKGNENDDFIYTAVPYKVSNSKVTCVYMIQSSYFKYWVILPTPYIAYRTQVSRCYCHNSTRIEITWCLTWHFAYYRCANVPLGITRAWSRYGERHATMDNGHARLQHVPHTCLFPLCRGSTAGCSVIYSRIPSLVSLLPLHTNNPQWGPHESWLCLAIYSLIFEPSSLSLISACSEFLIVHSDRIHIDALLLLLPSLLLHHRHCASIECRPSNFTLCMPDPMS